MKIRTLTIGDYDAMVQLWTRAGLPFKPKGRDSRQMIEKQIEAFPELFIGAFHQGKLAGLVIGSYDVRMKGWINRLAVDPGYQRQGIAQELVGKVEEALERRGAAIFGALIETPNEESLRLFQKMGYSTHPDILYVSKRKSEDA
jgi:ribosomal protein S18 acetylase RimI-like enzyme